MNDPIAQLSSGAHGVVRAIPPLGWVAVVGVLGVGAIMYTQFHQSDEDHSWLDPEQPPTTVGMPGVVPGSTYGSGRPGECSDPFRDRPRPDTVHLIAQVSL